MLARLVAPQLAQRLGQDFVVEDKPGAGGNIGADYVIHAAPDGYTLLVMISGNAANAALYPNLDFNFVRDIVPVAFLGYTPFVVVVHPSIPVKTIPELVAYAKANPGKLNFASQGAGTAPHLAFELFRMMTGVNIVHVPYRASYLPDLLAGQVQVAFATVPPVLGYIGNGKLGALGVTSVKAMEALPDVPPIGASLPGYEGSGWAGVGAPRGTPADVIETLNKAINAVLADPALRAALHFARRRAGADDVGAIRHADRQRRHQVGEGDQLRQHQGGLKRMSRPLIPDSRSLSSGRPLRAGPLAQSGLQETPTSDLTGRANLSNRGAVTTYALEFARAAG